MASLAAGAAVAETPRWFTAAGAAGLSARWGIPSTDAVGFEIRCEGAGVRAQPALYAVNEPSARPQVRFRIDGEDHLRPADLTYRERDGAWQASALLPRDDSLIDALRRGEELTYDFEPMLREGDAFTLSLTGSAKAIDEALEAC